jgi:hypothetical protein
MRMVSKHLEQLGFLGPLARERLQKIMVNQSQLDKQKPNIGEFVQTVE